MKRKMINIFIAFIFVFIGGFAYAGSIRPNHGDYICWASPTPQVIHNCEKNNKCDGSGVYAWHNNLNIAKKTAINFCNKKFGSCTVDYCERLK